MTETAQPIAPPDSEHRGVIGLLPAGARPFALMARFDRPIGWWLLYWPGAWAIMLAGGIWEHWDMLLWFLLGSIVMRGAGCVWNDVLDRKLDAQVARTASRPLASGAVTVRAAIMWIGFLCAIGLVVLFQLNLAAAMFALGSILPVAAYPLMKRVTWWPQAWLGIVFSWAALVAWAEVTGGLNGAGALLYVGSIFWVIGYDTIYALQDIEDDALAGIKSSARALGSRVKPGVSLFYTIAMGCWAGAFWLVRADWVALIALVPMAAHLIWQVATLKTDNGMDALTKFRSNRFAGLLMILACAAVGSAF